MRGGHPILQTYRFLQHEAVIAVLGGACRIIGSM